LVVFEGIFGRAKCEGFEHKVAARADWSGVARTGSIRDNDRGEYPVRKTGCNSGRDHSGGAGSGRAQFHLKAHRCLYIFVVKLFTVFLNLHSMQIFHLQFRIEVMKVFLI